jgi:hypothetical protein
MTDNIWETFELQFKFTNSQRLSFRQFARGWKSKALGPTCATLGVLTTVVYVDPLCTIEWNARRAIGEIFVCRRVTAFNLLGTGT